MPSRQALKVGITSDLNKGHTNLNGFLSKAFTVCILIHFLKILHQIIYPTEPDIFQDVSNTLSVAVVTVLGTEKKVLFGLV